MGVTSFSWNLEDESKGSCGEGYRWDLGTAFGCCLLRMSRRSTRNGDLQQRMIKASNAIDIYVGYIQSLQNIIIIYTPLKVLLFTADFANSSFSYSMSQ